MPEGGRIRLLWLVLIVGTPLYLNPYSRWQVEPDKVALFIIIVGALCGISVWNGSWQYLPTNYTEKWIVLYLVISLICTTLSIQISWSLWGDNAWRNGILLTIACSGLYWLVRREQEVPQHQILKWTIYTGGVVAGVAICEYLLIDKTVRVSSTLGHPNLLAAYLAMLCPIALVYWLDTPPKRIAASILIIVVGIALILTYSRTGWLSALGGLVTTYVAWLWVSGYRRLAGSASLLVVCIVVVLGVLSILPPQSATAPHWLQTLTSLFRWTGATAKIRLLGWQSALPLIEAEPVLGYGPATYRIVVEQTLPAQLVPFGGGAALGGRPHNTFIEVALEKGLVGLLAYLGIIFSIAMNALRYVYTGTARSVHVIVLGICVAYCINGFFSFDTVNLLLLLMLIAGLAHVQNEKHSWEPSRPNRVRGGFIIIIAISAAIWMNVPDILAYVGESKCGIDLDCNKTQILEMAATYSPTPNLYRMLLAESYVMTTNDESDGWHKGAVIYNRLVDENQSIVEYWQRRGHYYRRWYLNDASHGSQLAEEGISSYTYALRISPENVDILLDRSLLFIDIEQYDLALLDIERADALLEGYARNYSFRSIYSSAIGDWVNAQFWNDQAQEARKQWDNWVWRR